MPDLKQASADEWRGACPIHQGTRDSFAVNATSGAWFCHSECGRGGSIFDLEMAIEGVDFPTAKRNVLRILAEATIRERNGKSDTNGNSTVASGMASAVSKRDLAVLDQRIQKFAKENGLRFIVKSGCSHRKGLGTDTGDAGTAINTGLSPLSPVVPRKKHLGEE